VRAVPVGPSFELQTPVELPEAVFTIPEHLAERVFDE